MQSVPITANVVSSNPTKTRCSQYIKSMYFKFLYHITSNFCSVKFLRFLTKRRHLIFADFFFCGLKILAPKKYCSCKQQLKRCYDKQLVHITVVLRRKNIFNSLESFQRLQLLNIHLINFNFVLRNNFFSLFS